jgi:A/G-specific adenine glycosylase
MDHSTAIRQRLCRWFQRAQRKLPWRATRDPYRIWVSEVMLQQTRVATVIPYYERFLHRFPDPASLASAPEEELLACWAGLGYYSRARNMQKAARQIVRLGAFPRDYDSLRKLAGVGDYTAAAIASIAFGLPHPVLDGNALRVLSRLTGETGDIGSSATRERLRQEAQRLLDRKRPGLFNQALMELGATICTPKQPRCIPCPLSGHCQARLQGTQNELPVKQGRAAPTRIEKTLFVIERQGKLLLWQRPADSSRLSGFWELPGAEPGSCRGSFRHSITNHNYRFHVVAGRIRRAPRGFRWIPRQRLSKMPLSTTTRKALSCLDI